MEAIRIAFVRFPIVMSAVRMHLLKIRGKPVGRCKGEPELTKEEMAGLCELGVIGFATPTGRSVPVMVGPVGVLKLLDRFDHAGREIGLKTAFNQAAPPSSRRNNVFRASRTREPEELLRSRAGVLALIDDDWDDDTQVMSPSECADLAAQSVAS